jgi:hypothetical protein
MTTYEIRHTKENNEPIVTVPLSNSPLKVRLLERDYEYLEILGVGLPWKLYLGYVAVRNNDKDISIARLLTLADKGQKVSYADGSPLNLTRPNLVIKPGAGRHRATDTLNIKEYKQNRPQIVHVMADVP